MQLRFWVVLIGIVVLIRQKSESGLFPENGLDVTSEDPTQSCTYLIPLTVCVNERLTFVVAPLCVHPVKTVKQPIDLRLYQSQLLFNHLQLLHAHCRDTENTEDNFNKLRLHFDDVVWLISATCITDNMVSFNVL